MVEWPSIQTSFPCGRSLAEGGFKTVFLVADTAGGLDGTGATCGAACDECGGEGGVLDRSG